MRQSIQKLLALCNAADIKRLKILFLLTLAVGLLEVAGIASVFPFLQLASNPESIDSNKFVNTLFAIIKITDPRNQLIFTGWCVLLFITLSNAIAAYSGWTIQKIGWTLSHTISIRIVDRYLNAPYEFYLERETAELIKSTTNDINNLVINVMISACRFLTKVAVIMIIILLLAVLEPMIALITLLFLSSSFLLVFLLRKNHVSNLGKAQLRANGERYTSFVDLLNGIKTIQSSGAQDYFHDRFDVPSKEFSSILPKLFVSGALPKYVIETFVFGSMILIIIYLTRSDQSFSTYLPVITLYAFAGYRLLPSLNSAYISATAILGHHHVIDTIYHDYKHGANTEKYSVNSLPFNNEIKFKNVSYKYKGSTGLALDKISFSFEKGQNIALVGTSGSGKSTLGTILAGLIDPTNGAVYVDDIERSKSHSKSWIDQIGYVPQEVFLYNATVKENVIFGLEEHTADVEKACRIAQIHTHIVEKLPKGYDSLVGDSGIKLSGGQKQRIGLARAIYRNPSLLLLDEATSALDIRTEKQIFDGIYEQLSKTTLVIIAHRVSTVRRCDKILVLDEGRLVTEGNYNDLINKSPLFKELNSFL